MLWIVACDWKRQRPPRAVGGVVGTVMSNFGLEQALARDGIAFRRASVGDRNVARLMDETGADLGGETSGHILLSPLSPAGDGILTALVIAGIVRANGGRLSRLATLEKVPQTLRNVRVARRVALEDAPGVRRALGRAESDAPRREAACSSATPGPSRSFAFWSRGPTRRRSTRSRESSRRRCARSYMSFKSQSQVSSAATWELT